MHQQTFNLISHEVKANCIHYIHSLETNGKLKVTVSDIGTKSDRQHRLDWKWSTEIHNSGIGWDDDTIEKTHARSKWMFALPIMLMEFEEPFQSIHEFFMNKFGHDKNKCIEYAINHLNTKKFSVRQAAEYMGNKERYWLQKGVSLTNPDLYGLKFK